MAKVNFLAKKNAGIFFEMIHPEKVTAVQKFAEMHQLNPRVDVVGVCGQRPELLSDIGFRHEGLTSAVTLYKVGLYKQGIPPSVILEGANALKKTLDEAELKTNNNDAEKKNRNPIRSTLSSVSRLARVFIRNEAESDVMPRKTYPRTLQPGVAESVRRRRNS